MLIFLLLFVGCCETHNHAQVRNRAWHSLQGM
jgi:hypothetical protein